VILSKFNRHLQSQNWLGVILDFLVVVIGIFVALQAADWNQSRLDRKEESYQLQFLYEELVNKENTFQVEFKEHQDILEKSFVVSMLLTKDSWQPNQRKIFEQNILSLFSFWGASFRPVSLRRLIDGAYLEAIEQTKYSYGGSMVVTPQITSSIIFDGMNIVSTDKELLDNQRLRSVVRDKAVLQRIQIDTLSKLQKERQKLIKILEPFIK
jgi:hypothetical protein